MTCIVGVINNDGTVSMGGDSAAVSSGSLTIRKDFIKDSFLIGYTSSFRILRFQCNFPKYIKEIHDNEDQYMCTVFIEEIRSVFKSYGYSEIDSNQEFGGSFLVGFRGRIFEIHDDFQVAESMKPYAAVGCGEKFALGSLFSSNSILKALEAAEGFSCYFTIIQGIS